MQKSSLAAILASILVTACSSSAEATLLPTPPSPQPTATSAAQATPGHVDSRHLDAAMPLVELARLDLAQRLSIPVGAIELVKVEAVEWPDSSLGCPQEGMAFAQVITPGYLITITNDVLIYEYHSSLAGITFLCESGTDTMLPILPPPKDADDRNPSQPINPLPTVALK